MSDRAEIERLDKRAGLTSLPEGRWEFELDLGDHPERTMARIREVAREIASQEDDAWPADKDWKEILPDWIKTFVPERSREEADHLMATTPREKWSLLPWDFGSWLDAMRERGWKWWGYDLSGRKARLVLQVTSIPPRVEAFKQILFAAGAQVLSEEFC